MAAASLAERVATLTATKATGTTMTTATAAAATTATVTATTATARKEAGQKVKMPNLATTKQNQFQ